MNHWIHQRLCDLIAKGGKKRPEVCAALDIKMRTLVRRLQDGSWTLAEIIAAEKLYGVQILVEGAKYGVDPHAGVFGDATAAEQAPYRIKIEIDPAKFQPHDLELMNRELTEKLLGWYKLENTK